VANLKVIISQVLTDSKDLDLMSWNCLPVQCPLNRHRSILADGELPPTIRGPVYGVRHLAVAAPIRISRTEFFQS
jgi:hypothetical protein